MKKSIIVLMVFIFMMSCLMAANDKPIINQSKPLIETNYVSESLNSKTTMPTGPNRQSFLDLDFTGLNSLPAGWTAEVDTTIAHWSIRQTNLAGGTAPELCFADQPYFTGISRYISPEIDLTGISSLNLMFLHSVDHYTSPYTLGVATRSNHGAWTNVWTLDPTATVISQVVDLLVGTADVGSSTFQVCFYFSGYSYNINKWLIDDINLFIWPHDIKTLSLTTEQNYSVGASFVPSVVVGNIGQNSESFSVTCEISQFETVVYSQTVDMTLGQGRTGSPQFPSFTIPAANEIYKITVTANLANDQNTANNSKTNYFYSYVTERQKMMLEIATGTWCQFCPGAAMGAEDLVANGKDVAVVEYHNQDPYVNAASNARNEYYMVPGYPTATFDGQRQIDYGNHSNSLYSTYLPIYEDAITKMSPFYISMTGAISDTDTSILNVNVNVIRFGRILPDEPLVLHFAVTESDIACIWQGQTEVSFVERAMTPDENGTDLNIANVESQSIPLTTTLGAAWNVGNLEVVAFIQNPITKVIYQGYVKPLLDLSVMDRAYPPRTLAAVHSGDEVTLTWLAPSSTMGLSAYVIYRDGAILYTKTRDLATRQFVDPAIPGDHVYLVKALFGGVYSTPSNQVNVNIVANDDAVATPVLSRMISNYPSPYNRSTRIRYEMVKDAKVSLAVYNVRGQLVRSLVNEVIPTGIHEIVWNGKDNDGNSIASGVYFYHFSTGSVKQVRKTILLK